jgi:hypothetical protein
VTETTDTDIAALRNGLTHAYTERANLTALLAALYPSGWNHADTDHPGWFILYIQLPTGQATWHISPDDWWIFANVPHNPDLTWDGHTTEQKYQRIRDLIAQIESGNAPRAQAQGATAVSSEPIHAEPDPELRQQIAANAQQLQQLIIQTAPACATCLHEERGGVRPGHNLANTVIDGTAYCNEHLDDVGGRLVPRKTSGLIITGG